MKGIAFLRQEYAGEEGDGQVFPAEPVSLFGNWLEAAIEAKVAEPNAMVLATVRADGCPAARVVLLKDFSEQGFSFFTNYESAKAQEIRHSRVVALTFHWAVLCRQVRIEGVAEPVSQEEADAYFNLRPRGAQLSAWASPQSQVVESRSVLEMRYQLIEKQFEGEQRIPRPPHWGGFRVMPASIEFWQGRANRLHDRLRYRRLAGSEEHKWQRDRLAP